MATALWGSTDQDATVVTSAAGAQTAPAVADNGGTEFGVAWIDGGTITVKFFDEQGLPTAARPTSVVTDGVYGDTALQATVTNVEMSAGGTGIGYGLVWEESAAGEPTLLRLRYIGLTTTFGPEISVSTSAPGLNQHDAAIAGYTKDDANGRPNVDGFDLAWVESAGGTHTLGQVFFQRFAVPLDARKDPAASPTVAGLDGRVAADPQNNITLGENQVLLSASGRDPSVAVLLGAANESVVTWIDAQNHIHLRIYNDDGSLNTTDEPGGPVNATGAPPANLGTAAPNGELHTLALAGGEFVVAWVTEGVGGNLFVLGRVYTPGAAAGTFTSSPVIALADVPETTTDFSLAALPDGGGFMVTWNGLDAGSSAIFTRTFTNGGLPVDTSPTLFHAPADATDVAVTGLIGDRVVAVYQDNSTPGDPSNIGAQIFDTRTQADGTAIVLNGPGLTLIGDPAGGGGGGGGAAGAPDVLVGTIGNDFIDGVLNDDVLDGALGDDIIIGGGGNDIIDGGGGIDTVRLTGNFTIDGDSSNDDYLITFEGGSLFTITDLRAGSPDGVDTIRNVELFAFAGTGTTFTAAELAGQTPEVTPTPWGLTDEDGDAAPSFNRVADTDGFLVNTGGTSQPGAQFHPVIADSVGEFVGILWETDPSGTGDTFIRGQFLDVLAQPDTDTPLPNAINVSDGIGIEFNPAIVSGGANGGWGIAFEEISDATDTTAVIRTNFVGPGTLTGVEQTVLDEGPNVNQHDVALSGSFLDRTQTFVPTADTPVDPKIVSDGYNAVWVSTDLDPVTGAALNVPGDAEYGRIMLQRFEVPFDAVGNPAAPVGAGIDGLANNTLLAPDSNDLPVWVGDEANGLNGAVGRNPSTAALHSFETAVIWIEQDGAGGERVAGRAYDDLGHVIPVPEFSNISGAFPVAAGTNAYIVQAGAVNFGIAWITPDATSPSGYSVMGTMFSSAGAGINGEGFALLAPAEPFVLQQLPAGFDPATSDFHLTSISGEDSQDLIISWNLNGDVEARHIRTTLDPVTGVALSLSPEGDVVTINAATDGVQDQNGLAGLLSDRFIAVYHDTSGVTGDTAGDIVARVFDTREPGQVLVGDTVNNGVLRATADIIVGTVGDDTIIGDVLDNDGRTDQLYGGMGNDILQGGPDTSQAARVEVLDGGEGIDTAVYTGRFTDYSITINGDGSFTVIDLRPKQDPNTGAFLQNDGMDHIIDIEQLQFLGEPGASIIPIGFAPPLPPPDPNFNGTPTPWSLTDESPFKEILISTDPAGGVGAQPGTQSQISVAALQTEAAMSWVSDGNHIFGVRFEVQGDVDPVFSTVPVELTDGPAADSVADPFTTMAGGLGFLTAWESTTAGQTSIHMAFGSTATNTVFDPAAGFPGSGLAKEMVGSATDDPNVAEDTVVGSDVAGQVAVDPVVQGYEIVDVNNDTLEFGFHVAYVLKGDAGNANGTIMLARYDIPVYDIDPVTGALVLDASGNPTPSADFGGGAETQPVSIGTDGLRGTADDTTAITVATGRDPSLAGLHDGQLVVTYIDENNHVQLRVYSPQTDENADRETAAGVGGTDIFVRGLTTFNQLALPFATDLGVVAAGQTQHVVAAMNGSFGVFWAEAGATAGTIDIKAIIYTFGGADNWVPSEVLTLETGLDAGIDFQVAHTAVDSVGLEDGFLLNWEQEGQIFEQRIDMAGNLVGDQVRVDDPATGSHTGLSTAALEDGRLIVGYEGPAGDVSSQYLDTRQAGAEIVGDRLGAARDVLVGTTGDDAMTGGEREDQLFGGIGNDVLSGGQDGDALSGGVGNDILIGGTGQDQLLGDAGDDLLWGGLSSPADPKVDRDLQAGLTAAGVDPNLIATEPGADIVSGGDGTDTISFQGEFGRFNIDLSTGIVTSDRTNTGTFLLEDVIGQIVDDGAGGTIFTFINDVENATGGFGDDVLIGNAGDNVLDGGAGSNTIDGGGGSDTVILNGNFADFQISFDPDTNTFIIVDATDPTQANTITNVETFRFADGDKTIADLALGPVAQPDVVTVAEDSSVTFDVRANDAFPSPVTVTAVNGTQITSGGPAVAVAHGSVTLGTDGQLTFTPTPDYFGPAEFSYEITDAEGRFSTASVAITVTNVNDTPTDIVFNGNPALNTASVAENSPTGTVVATLSTLDPDNANGVVNDTFTYTLQDNQGGRFQIVGDQIKVLNGALLDFESGVNTFNLNVTVSDGHAGSTRTETVTVNVTNVNEAPTNVALTNAAFAETAANGFVIGTFSGIDPEGGAIRYSLADDANGRFSIVRNGASYQLAVAENLLIDHRLNPNGDADHTYSIQVRATDASGASSLQTLTVTATGVAENRITGTAADNTLAGTGNADFIDGGAGRDTMTGGAGNDVYVIDNGNDKVIEAANGGIDTIYTTLSSFDLNSQSNVENLVFIGTGDFTLTNFTGKAGSLSGTVISSSGNDRLEGGNGNDTLEGRAGNDTLSGGNGNDTLIGGLGNDTLNGGNGNDTLVFAAGWGSDVIQGFGDAAGNQDVIDLASAAFASFAELQAAMVQSGSNVVITDAFGDTLTIQNVTLASLGADDFHFF